MKIADGLHDPVGVASAFDGSGRIFVVERVGRIRIVTKDGKLLDQPFLDLTKINPLGNEVQTGFRRAGSMVGRLRSGLQEERVFLRPLLVAAV